MNAPNLARRLLEDEDEDDLLAYLDRDLKIVQGAEYKDESGTVTPDPQATLTFDLGWFDAEKKVIRILCNNAAEPTSETDLTAYASPWMLTWRNNRPELMRITIRIAGFTPGEMQLIRDEVNEYNATHI